MGFNAVCGSLSRWGHVGINHVTFCFLATNPVHWSDKPCSLDVTWRQLLSICEQNLSVCHRLYTDLISSRMLSVAGNYFFSQIIKSRCPCCVLYAHKMAKVNVRFPALAFFMTIYITKNILYNMKFLQLCIFRTWQSL